MKYLIFHLPVIIYQLFTNYHLPFDGARLKNDKCKINANLLNDKWKIRASSPEAII